MVVRHAETVKIRAWPWLLQRHENSRGLHTGRCQLSARSLSLSRPSAPSTNLQDAKMTIAQSSSVSPSASSDELKARLVLQHVAIMHRHGDRSPVFDQCGANLFVGDKEKKFWRAQLATSDQVEELAKIGKVVGPTPDQQPAGPPKHGGVFPGGNVTQRGLARLERVGAELRERYADFIDPNWSNNEVFVESTGFYRTIQSTQSFLKGMFPPRQGREAFFIRTNEFDTLSPSHPMDVYDSLEVKLERDMNEKYGPGGFEKLRERAYAALGADRSRPVPWSAARDILDCNRAHDVPVPEALPADVVKEICAVDCYMWHQLYGNLDFCRTYFRKGVREVFDILDQAAKQTNEHKLAVLSAHDSSIVSLLKALRVDLPSDSVPWYGSHVCMETYIDPVTRASFLKLTLNGSPLVIGSSTSWAGEFSEKESAGTITSPSSSAGDDPLTPFPEVEAIVREFFAGTDA